MTDPGLTGLVEDLRKNVRGEVRSDAMSRQLYSTDASMYSIEPVAVVIPRSADDVVAVIETAGGHRVPVLPRGAGTSLAGQTVGRAVVIDFSMHMRNVLEINAEEGWARVQPGVVLDELNEQLKPHGLQFAPDPSTSNRASVGGAVGNNSCGAHSIVWGKTVDNVLELSVVLSNGDTARFGPTSAESIAAKARRDDLEGAIYRRLADLGETTRGEVESRYPKIMRRVSGYNLDELAGGVNGFDTARFVVGSEGTLAAITEAKLRLVPIPTATALAIVHFNGLQESMEATVAALELEPSAVELVGSMILRYARSNLQYARIMDFVDGDPEALLAIELTGENAAEVESKLDRLERRMRSAGLGYAFRRVVSPQDQAKVWAVRKAGLGLMMNVPGAAKPLPFVEDTAVAPEALPDYVRRFDGIVRDHGTTAGYYGHASVGCLHIRPLVDLKLQDGVDRMVSIATQVSDLVLEFGGAMSGEHGDGLARSMWNEKMFGPAIYDAFRQVKQVFDPKGIMNPGKIVDPPPMTENLRIDPSYRTLDLKTGFSYGAENGFAGAVEMCNGQGACRKLGGGTMCPSYMATRDEEHSTRGRANALRAAISGALPVDALTSERLHQVMDLCLECKACKAECPTNVDMTKLKYEFLDRYHKANGFPLRSRIFANIATLSRLGSFLAPVSNWTLGSHAFRELLDRYAGIDRRRRLPAFASQTFVQWSRAQQRTAATRRTRGQVLLLADTFTNYNHPEVGRAATRVLEALGYEVVVPPTRCCGRPMLSKGMMDKARRNARSNVDQVLPYVKNGARLVGLEPSCILTFRDDYVDLLGGDADAALVGRSAMLIEEFFLEAQADPEYRVELRLEAAKLLFHGHCQQKALVGTGPAMEVLAAIRGCETVEIQSGCCGMAGSFGFESEHFDISLDIGEIALLPAIRSEPGNFDVVIEGVSCRQQIEHGTGKRARHLAEVLADAL